MSKRFIAIIAVCVAVFFGIIFFSNRDAEAPNSEPVSSTSHRQGGSDAKVELVEYGDFECPACSGYFSILKEVKAKYGDQISFQFRHFPIVSIHRNAMAAHRAAEAAAKQGKFWEMHDLIYENQTTWSSSNTASTIFESYAESLGLDMERYRNDVASSETQDIINADKAEGEKLDITGTPTFFLNGEKLDNSAIRSVDDFSKVIDEALDEE